MFRDGNIFFYENEKSKKRKNKGYLKEKEKINDIKQVLKSNENFKNYLIRTKQEEKLIQKAEEHEKIIQSRLDKAKEELKKLQETSPIIHKGLKRKIKKRKNSWIKEEVLKIIEERIKEDKYLFLTKEDIARKLEVKECQVEQVFMELNREGILSQAIHKAPHDSKRDPWGFDCNYFWNGDIYRIRKQTKKE